MSRESLVYVHPGTLVVNGREVNTSILKLVVYILSDLNISVMFSCDCSEHLQRQIIAAIQAAAREAEAQGTDCSSDRHKSPRSSFDLPGLSDSAVVDDEKTTNVHVMNR
jgi:hypothetical protein